MEAVVKTFPPSYDSSSMRLIATPSTFAKQNLLFVQETGRLKLLEVHHHTERRNLSSYLLVAVREGSGRLEYDGRRFTLEAGQFFFIDCQKRHMYQSDESNPWELWWVHFNGRSAPGYYSLFSTHCAPVFESRYASKLTRALSQLLEINRRQNLDTELENARMLTDMVTTLVLEKPTQKQSAAQEKMAQVRDYLRDHFTQEISLDALCERFYISKYYLIHEFKRCYGETIFQYILHKRITQAKHLLRFTTDSVGKISEECGFKESGYFNRQFKRAEGISATAYRRQWRG